MIHNSLRFLLLFLFASFASFGQILRPATWTQDISKTSVKVGDVVELVFRTSIDDAWYMYASDFDPDCGPIAAELEFAETKNFEVVGKLISVNSSAKTDENFPDCKVIKYFKKTGEFRQKIKITGSPVSIAVALKGQVCTFLDGTCVNFEEDFSFDYLQVEGGASTPNTTTPKSVEKKGDNQSSLGSPIQLPLPTPDSAKQTVKTSAVYGENKGPVLDPTILEGDPSYGNDSFWSLLVLAFVAGLTSLITPCVFPMIPMTVTFFLKDNQSRSQGIRNAIIFGLSIIVLYSSAGTLFAIILGPEGLNAMATNWALNLFIFIVFLIFALSFFGLFEINAPYQLVNKVDRQAEKGGLVGIFFMAFTLVLISFSCTVPIVGSVLALSAGGAVLKPILMMLAYSLAFALPFAIFAFFPEVLKSMPKSGGWLNSVKVVLGFVELALALKFFSIADQTYHWGLLDRDLNIALWIVIFTLMGFYLLGKIRLPNDSPLEKISVGRLMLAIATFSFVIYLIPGLWGAPLKALAGYLPPMYTHDFDLVSLNRNEKSNEICDTPKYSDFLHLPHGLKGYFDYDQALACARAQNKPLFIDFTGHGCTNCREMEANVWSDPQVLERLKNDYVVVALYVDDKTELPQSEWYTSKYDNKVKKTIGKQNADLQIQNLENNAQPFYVLVGKDERVLAWPKDFDRSVKNFVDFLESGKKTYSKLYPN
ncbi:MAG TPA: cytochrome c biogenesis protein CcdA [Chryseosolibacter sp.]